MNIQPAKFSADMHTHTRRSDGSMYAAQHMAYAARRGLKAVVITDHNICRSQDYDAAKFAATQHGLKTMPGIEIYTSFNGLVMDILGYGFDPKSNLNQELEQTRQEVANWNRDRLIAAIEGERLHIDPCSLEQKWDGFWLEWCHASSAIAKELGISFREGVKIFDKYHPQGWLPPLTMTPDKACDLIHKAGGKSDIAHSGIYLRNARALSGIDPFPSFYELVLQLKEKHGLIALELLHPGHSKDDIDLLSRTFGSIIPFFTGGSDFHGLAINPCRFMGNWGMDMAGYERFERAVIAKY